MRKITKTFLKIFALCNFFFSFTLTASCATFDQNLHVDRMEVLKSKGFEPKIIYDIGAFRGYWSLAMHQLFPQGQFYLFEANDNNRIFLEVTQFPYFLALLGDEERVVTFYTNDSTGDSVYCEQTKYYQEKNCKEKHLQMTTLLNIVEKNKLPLPDLVKMDVQGAETLIIKGGLPIILHAEVVILETKILEYNKDAPLIYEVMAYMNALGYSISDILECHYLPTGELNEIDLLFVKTNSKLIKKGLLIP